MNYSIFILNKHGGLARVLIRLFASFIFCILILAQDSVGQSVDSVNVTIELRKESLAELFQKIENQSSLRFAYKVQNIERYSNLNLPLEARTVRATLDLIFQDTPLRYKQVDNNVIVNEEQGNSGTRNAEDVVITGRVKTRDGTPLPGVSVFVKGTTTGTATNPDGTYAVEVGSNDVLIFSFIGFKTYQASVTNMAVMDVVLEEDATTLNEVQINGGYYSTTQATSTSNIARVTAADITRQPSVNPLQSLQGRMAGVEIVQQSGIPGSAISVQIRGRNSLRPDASRPLYVIDGVQVASSPITSYGSLMINGTDPLNAINPENIETFEVLKDADATAIYGSRGANGVVLITTKRAKDQEGRTSLEASFYSGVGKANQVKNLMNARQYLRMRNEAFDNDNVSPSATPGLHYAPDLMVWDTTRNTDWQDVLFGGTANISDAQLALSGGGAATSFRFGMGYHSETLVFPGDFGYQKISGNMSVNHRSKDKKFSLVFTANYAHDNNELFDGFQLIPWGMNLAPVAPKLYDDNGDLNWEIVDGRSTWYNPMSVMRKTQQIKNDNLIANTVLQYGILKGLTFKANTGFSRMTSDEVIITPLSSFDPTTPGRNSTAVAGSSSQSWILEPQLVFKHTFGKLFFDAVAGSTWQSTTTSHQLFTGYDYLSDNLLGDLGAATPPIDKGPNNTSTQYRYNAFFARLSFNWNEKYLLNLTGRRDGSSRFGSDKKFANFGAIGAGWIFSEENFMKDQSLLSFGKLRASFGTTGSDQIGDYQYFERYEPTPNSYQNTIGLVPVALLNPDYAWEINKKLETGLELGFLNDRILFSASWYLNRSSNQLLDRPLPLITGFASVLGNSTATVQNTGVEFTITATSIQAGDFKWTSSFNLTIPRNKLISYPGLAGSGDAGKFIIGESLSIRKLFHVTGVNPQTGLYEIQDVNGDNSYTQADRTEVIDLARKFYGGIGNNLSWKGFEFSFFFEFVRQQGENTFYLYTMPGTFSVGSQYMAAQGNQPTSVFDRWQQEGDISDVMKFSQSGNSISAYDKMAFSDRAFSDASFIRLKTVSLGYNVPAKWMQKIKLQSCHVYVQGQNLLTFTKYDGLDPQAPGRKSLPALKMITAGVQLTF